MVDHVDAKTRSQMMSRVRGKDTRPEILVRSLVHKLGRRFRLHDPRLPGKPDLVLARSREVIFVHGCFWHQHNCSRGARPSSNRRFWNKKLDGNVRRDREVRRELKLLGWRNLIVWECETRNIRKIEQKLLRFFGQQPRLIG
jgi:DNA mismatch endonuclease (patch repair protein)